jgi:hypothetical protein
MAIDISNDRKKFIQELYAQYNLSDELTDQKLKDILDWEANLEMQNPKLYDFKTSVNENFKTKIAHKGIKPISAVTTEKTPISDDKTYQAPTLKDIEGNVYSAVAEQFLDEKDIDKGAPEQLTEKDFKLNEDDFLQKAKRVYPDKFEFKTAQWGKDAIKITNKEGKSKVIQLNTPILSSTGRKGNELAFQQFTDFIDASIKGISPKSKTAKIYSKTKLKKDEYYRLEVKGSGSVKPNIDDKEYTKKMERLVNKVEELTAGIITNPGAYIDELPADMNMFDTEWLDSGNNQERIKDVIYESVVRKSKNYLGGRLDRDSFDAIIGAGGAGLYKNIMEIQKKKESRKRTIEVLKNNPVDTDRVAWEDIEQYKKRDSKQKIKIQLVKEIRELNKQLKNATTTADKNSILLQIKEKEKQIKRNATSKDINFQLLPGQKPTTINKDLASIFYDMYEVDTAENMIHWAESLLNNMDEKLLSIDKNINIGKISIYDAFTMLRKDKISEFDYLVNMGEEKKIKIDLSGFKKISFTRSRVVGALNRHLDDKTRKSIKNNILSISYDDIDLMKEDMDFTDLKGAVSEEDFNWMKIHKSAIEKNTSERHVLYDLTEMNRDPGYVDKPGFVVNMLQSAVSSTLQDIFGYSKYEANKVATLSEQGRADVWLSEFQDLVTEYNETYGEDNPIQLTKQQIKNLEKSLSATIAEGAGHFLPIIVKLGIIGRVVNPLLSITGVANKLMKMTQSKNLYTRLEGHFLNSMIEEAKGQPAGFGVGTMSVFYGANVALRGIKFHPMWNPVMQKIVKQGFTGLGASEVSLLLDEGLLKNNDFKAVWNELYGEYSDFEKRMLVTLINFKMLGATHIKPSDLPWKRTIDGLKNLELRAQKDKLDVILKYEQDLKEGKVKYDDKILGTEDLSPIELFARGKAQEKYQSKYDAYNATEADAAMAFDVSTKAYEINPEHPNFEKNVKERLLDPYNNALREVIGENFENIELKWVETLGEGIPAEYNPKTNVISAVKGKFNIELFNHEISHATTRNYFKANPTIQMSFAKSFARKFRKFNFEITDPFDGKRKNIKQFIKENYGKNGKVLDLRSEEARVNFNNEFISYAMQLLTRPEVNRSMNAVNVFQEMGDVVKSHFEGLGMKNNITTMEGLINGMARLGRTNLFGTTSPNQIQNLMEGFKNLGIFMTDKSISKRDFSQERFEAKDISEAARELNNFVESSFRLLDWKNLSESKKKDFGEKMGIHYEGRIRGILKNRYPDLTQEQIENISTLFVDRNAKDGFTGLVTLFDPAKNDSITGYLYNATGGIEVRLRKFVAAEKTGHTRLEDPAYMGGETSTTLGETIPDPSTLKGPKIELGKKQNEVDPTTDLTPIQLTKARDGINTLHDQNILIFDYKTQSLDPKSLAKLTNKIIDPITRERLGIESKPGNAYTEGDVKKVIKWLKKTTTHNGKKITIGELIFNGMPISNVNPNTGKEMGIRTVMKQLLYDYKTDRAKITKVGQGTGIKIKKNWLEIGGIEGIEKIFEQLKKEGKRGHLNLAEAWVDQYNKLLGNTLAREKAKTENAKAEVLEEMTGGYIDLKAVEIKNEWNRVPGMTENMVQYYIGEYAKDPDKFKSKYSQETIDMVENIIKVEAYNRFIEGKASAAHYDLNTIKLKDITLSNGDKITKKEQQDISNDITYLTKDPTGKKYLLEKYGGEKDIREVDVKRTEEFVKMAQEFSEYLPKGMGGGLKGFAKFLSGIQSRSTAQIGSKDTKGFRKLRNKDGEKFDALEWWMNPPFKNIGKNKKAQELYKNLTFKDFKQLTTLRKAYEKALKLREEGKIEEADKVLEKTFSLENENVKRKLYYQFNSAKQLWLEDAPNKKEYLRRYRYILTLGKLQDNIVGGERALVPIHAVYLPGGQVKGIKLEHIQSMVERSLETARAIVEGRWISEGKKLTKSYKGVLGEKESFDVIDFVGGKTNTSGIAKLVVDMEKLKYYRIVGDKGITNVTLYDQLMHTTAQSLGRMGRELTQPYIKDMFYKYVASKAESDRITLEKAIKDPKWAKIHARHVQAVIKSGLHADKNMSTSQLAELLNLKTKAARIYLDPNAKKKGGSVYDLDRTLYEGIEKVTVTMPSGKKLRLNSEEFAREYDKLQKEGGEFDYLQFDKMFGNKKGPLFKHLLEQQEQHGSEHLYILTARSPGATKAIHEWLKRNGVDMPIDNIVTLQDGRPEAKANWFIGKIVEKNYNDLFFTDDMKANVNAVSKVLDKLGINSKIREVNAQAAKDLSSDWNRMIEETTGVEAFKVISQATARKSGRDIDKWRWWLPSSAQHFLTLNYKFFGKGKQGDKHREWFDKVLAEPYAKGNYQLNIERARLRDDYKALLKDNKNVKKILKKDTGYRGYTFEHAARVYLWDSFGINMEKHGLTKTDTKKLIQIVKSNPELQAFADQLPGIANIKEGYIAPNKYWVDEGIAHDIRNIGGKVYRKELLKTWVDNKNKIYTPDNLNKIEKIYGTRYREALEDILYRMEYDTSKSFGKDRKTNSLSKYISNATATVMFLNRRSALTQTISSLNFIEATGPNNIWAAAKAFAGNPKQYWKDFVMIFNSPMLKQRRLGNKLDVNYAELVNTMRDKKDPITAVSAWMLEKGFIFTKGADSFAIAFGGAGYYRNYINHYLKKGMSKVEAIKTAFLKFQEASEPTQQSTRADLISQEQASPVGRFVHNFQNVSLQNNNNMYRGILDVINGRGDMKTNISKIIYYGAVQNIMFLSLQQALFSAYFDPEDTEELQQAKVNDKMVGIGNGMLDILLRGSGISGAVVSTLKNVLMQYVKETQKGYKGDQAKVLIQALNFSPSLGSKARKFYSALQDDKFSKETTIQPTLLAAEAITNIPFNEFYEMVGDGVLLSNQELENWQRLSIILGYRPWHVGIDVNEGDEEETGGDLKISDLELIDLETSDLKIN